MQDHVIQWFRAVLGTDIVEGYGQTETSASTTAYLFGDTVPGRWGLGARVMVTRGPGLGWPWDQG